MFTEHSRTSTFNVATLDLYSDTHNSFTVTILHLISLEDIRETDARFTPHAILILHIFVCHIWCVHHHSGVVYMIDLLC